MHSATMYSSNPAYECKHSMCPNETIVTFIDMSEPWSRCKLKLTKFRGPVPNVISEIQVSAYQFICFSWRGGLSL